MGAAIKIGATSSTHVSRSWGATPETTSATAPTARRASGSLPLTRVLGTVRRGVAEQAGPTQLEELAGVQQIVRGPGGEQVAGGDRSGRGAILTGPVGGGEGPEPGQRALALGQEALKGLGELPGVVLVLDDPGLGIDGGPRLVGPVQHEIQARSEVQALLAEQVAD